MATLKKVSCNTSVDAAVLSEARALNLSPSAILEDALGKAIKAAKYERWCQENKQAITEHNRKIEKQGTFSQKNGQL